MQNTSSYSGLDRQYQALKAVVEHPNFHKIIAEIHKLPPVERLKAAFTRLTPEALKESGVPIPEGLSMSATASEEESTSEDLSMSATASENTPKNIQLEAKWCFFPWAYGSPSAALQPKLFVPSVSISIQLA